jgi:uncharacterized protein YyaL (SSP411 family)
MIPLLQKPLFRAGLALAGLALLAGCGEKRETAGEEMPEEVGGGDFREIPVGNSLGGLPGSVYLSQAASPIHWQPWTKESLGTARNSRRLVLAVVAMPQQPSFVEILRNLSSDAATVELINSTYVPILIDGDAIREFGILSAELCSEIGTGLQLPLMVWMTPEANPVAWMPLPTAERGSASELFVQSHTMVARTWADDPEYVTRNSRLDQSNRRERMLQRFEDAETSEEPAADGPRALRQLTSLYDPSSRTFDEAGGLFPVGVLDVLSMSSKLSGLPEGMRDRSLKVLDSLLDDILVSPMFDPLDGGVFNSRRGSSWSFPGYNRDCSSQARVIVSLLNAYEATGEKRALDRAMGIMGFIRKNHMTEAGLFPFGSNGSGDAGKWLWLYEDVREILSPEELPVWMAASGMKESGNLPSELDPLREHFRANSIAFAKSPGEVADLLGIESARAEGLLESARAKLLEARDDRMRSSSPADKEPNAVATFRMVSAYATAYRITGQTSYRDLASETLSKAREHFAEGPRLKVYPGDGPDSLLAARAFVYGVAIQAALDVEAITLKGDWLLWAGDLSSTVSEEFSPDTYVKECPHAADLSGLPVTDSAMLFDESTLGLLAMSESRLQALGIPLVPSLRKKLSAFPMSALNSPILHSDLIQAALMRSFSVTYVFGEDAPESLKEALARSPLKGVNRRPALPSDPPNLTPEPGGAIRVAPDGGVSPVRSAADVRVPSLP